MILNVTQKANVIFITVMFSFTCCAPTLREIGREQGCYAAEEYAGLYIERKVRRERLKSDLPYRVALLPLSVTVGFLFNYIGQLEFIVPLFAPTGFSLDGTDFGALYLGNVATYSPLHGTRLDEIDDSVIAFANFDIGMCYYEEDNFAQASAFFENLAGSKYGRYVGKENLFFLLGDCYYMLGMYDAAINNYRLFLEYSAHNDNRNELVKKYMKTIDVLDKKGLWGIEEGAED